MVWIWFLNVFDGFVVPFNGFFFSHIAKGKWEALWLAKQMRCVVGLRSVFPTMDLQARRIVE